MRVLIAYGSRRGGTAGLAQMISEALASHGIHSEVRAAAGAGSPEESDAVIVAGALCAGRRHRYARRFVRRHAEALRGRPVWLVSSGPLDGSARAGELPPVLQVARLGALVGARGQVTFGGRLAPGAKGFPARAMAKTQAGDWRDPVHVRDFTAAVTAGLRAGKALSP